MKHAKPTLAVISLALIMSASPVFAADDLQEQTAADTTAGQVENVAPSAPDSEPVAVAERASSFTADGDNITITIPKDDAGKLVLASTETGSQLSVGLPKGSDGGDAVATDTGVVTYQDSLPSTDLAVEPFTDSVRVTTILQDGGAPTEFRYPVDLQGGSLILGEDGAVLVTDGAGAATGGFAAPWAKDATGADVPTRYEIRGNNVVQVVDHRGGDFTYPIVADPWLWKDLIADAHWVYQSAFRGFTLQVAPTGWARGWAGSWAVGKAGWNELYKKFKNRGLNTNLGAMEDQFVCHQQIVAIRSPRKPTWNLDEWRPNVSYLDTVRASCNPSGTSSD